MKLEKKDKYKDSASIYKQLYTWKIKINVSDSYSDKTSNKSSFQVYDDIYFHVSISGGEPDAQIKLTYKLICPDGTTKEKKHSYGESDGGWDYKSYYTNYSWDTGTYKFKVYDSEGNYYAEKSIYFSYY